MNNQQIAYVNQAWNILYYIFGLLGIIAGLDKFFDIIVVWSKYLNPAIPVFLNVSPEIIMKVVGIIEIVAGILTFWNPLIGGYVIAGWLLIIVVNLVTMGKYFDIAIRDTVMALSSYVLVLLTKARQQNNASGK